MVLEMKIKELIVVEGKSDLTLLKSFLDADIVITNGSAISKETLEFIKEANKKQGVIILTDPDYPGLKIRNEIENYVGKCKHVYIEKSKAIKGNKVGVAETSKEDILEALKHVITYDYEENRKDKITDYELMQLGLIGKENSSYLRELVCNYFHLGWCNAKTFLKRVNMFGLTIRDLKEVIKSDCKQEGNNKTIKRK